MAAENATILKVTQPEGVFYYEIYHPELKESITVETLTAMLNRSEANKLRLDEALIGNRIHDFVTVSRDKIPLGTELRSEAQLREVLSQSQVQDDHVLFEVTLKNQTRRYFQIPPHRVGLSGSVLRDAREGDMIDEFQRVSVSEVPECEEYDAFRMLMAEVFLGLGR